jgi:hypothetical protein
MPEPRQLPPSPAWERIATFLAIFLLWPKIWAHWKQQPSRLADALMYAALVLMLVVLARKVIRIRRYWNGHNDGGEKE